MVLAWALLIVLVVALPAAVWLRSRHLKPYDGPVPKLNRADRWLYDRYQLGNLDRSRIRQAVIEGRELSEPPLREAAYGLAAALLAGEAGWLTRKKERICLTQPGARPTGEDSRPARASSSSSVFPDPRLVAAIVDRLTFNSHILETGTESY